jgi:hypothetical protein
MTIIDELKKKTGEGLKTLKETAGDIAFNVEKQARIARCKMDITRLQRKVQKLYGEIGEYVYGEYALARQIATGSPFLKDRFNSIGQLKLDIQDIERDMEVLKKAQPPGRQEPPRGSESATPGGQGPEGPSSTAP